MAMSPRCSCPVATPIPQLRNDAARADPVPAPPRDALRKAAHQAVNFGSTPPAVLNTNWRSFESAFDTPINENILLMTPSMPPAGAPPTPGPSGPPPPPGSAPIPWKPKTPARAAPCHGDQPV